MFNRSCWKFMTNTFCFSNIYYKALQSCFLLKSCCLKWFKCKSYSAENFERFLSTKTSNKFKPFFLLNKRQKTNLATFANESPIFPNSEASCVASHMNLKRIANHNYHILGTNKVRLSISTSYSDFIVTIVKTDLEPEVKKLGIN